MYLFLTIAILIASEASATKCGKKGLVFSDAHQGTIFSKIKNEETGKEYWTPSCVGAFLPGKYDNYTDSLYIGTGCVEGEAGTHLLRYGTGDTIEDTDHLRGRLISVFHVHTPEGQFPWNFGLSVVKFQPDKLDGGLQTACLPKKDDVPTDCRVSVITTAGRTKTLPVDLMPSTECSEAMPSYMELLGEDIPFDEQYQACAMLKEGSPVDNVKSFFGPVVCEVEGRSTVLGFYLLEPSTGDIMHPFRVGKVEPHKKVVEEISSLSEDELLG